VLTLLKGGMGATEVARKLKIGRASVHRILEASAAGFPDDRETGKEKSNLREKMFSQWSWSGSADGPQHGHRSERGRLGAPSRDALRGILRCDAKRALDCALPAPGSGHTHEEPRRGDNSKPRLE
jgi:hypothetical protein